MSSIIFTVHIKNALDKQDENKMHDSSTCDQTIEDLLKFSVFAFADVPETSGTHAQPSTDALRTGDDFQWDEAETGGAPTPPLQWG